MKASTAYLKRYLADKKHKKTDLEKSLAVVALMDVQSKKGV